MNKYAFYMVGFIVSGVLAQSSFARGRVSEAFREPQLTEVSWVGTFSCDEKQHGPTHKKDHRCDLQFVNNDSGESWNVKENPGLSELHQKYDGAVTARIEAMRSPRYLLGGSYVDVKQIAVVAAAPMAAPAQGDNREANVQSPREGSWSRR